jgi:hypothetical protein
VPDRNHQPVRHSRASAREFLGAICAALGSSLLLIATAAQSESSQQTGASAIVESAHLDFRIVVPKVLKLDMDTGVTFTNARGSETVLIAIEQGSEHRTSASRADRLAFHRVGANASAASSSVGPVSYTIAMP